MPYHNHRQQVIYNVGGGAPGGGPGCCGVPSEAPRAVTAARRCAILSIVIHVISFFLGGGLFVWQRSACFTAFVMGGLLLCVYERYMYVIGSVGFALCAVFDVLAVLRWITRDDEIFDSDDDYYTIFQDDDTQSEESSDSTILLWLAVPPFLGAIAMGLGAIFTFTAVFAWKYGGGTAIPHVPVAPQPALDFTKQPQSQQESKTAELGLAPPTAHPRTPPPAYHPQSPPPAYRR
ncbi:unnamed protein product [Ectocarpus sp. 4 AP-2014]